MTGETDVTVTEPKLTAVTVDPPTATIARMSTRAFKATATYDDATTLDVTNAATWTSSMIGVATISNADGTRGVATGVAAGTTTITATLEDKSGTATLTVSGMAPTTLVITPANPSLGRGASQQFTATATFPDNSTQDRHRRRHLDVVDDRRRHRGRRRPGHGRGHGHDHHHRHLRRGDGFDHPDRHRRHGR